MGIEVALLGAVVAGTAANVVTSRKQNKLAQREAKARTMIEERRAKRDRIASVREQQMAAAEMAVQGEGAGVASSSGVAGGIASVNTTAASNANFVNQVQSLNEIRARLMERSARVGMVNDVIQSVSGAVQTYAMTQQSAPKEAPKPKGGWEV